MTKETFATEKIYLKSTREKSQFISVIFVKDLIQYISSIVEDLEKQKKLQFENFDDNLWLLFSGDKGGKHMKFYFEVINCSNAGSVCNVHIFAMYEGSDSHSNITLVLPKFYEAIERLQNEEFSLIGHKVKVFLRSDYHFLDNCLGHQGSAATCPSSKDLVTLEHLRDHSGTAHTPEDCLIPEQTIEDLEASYNENLVDDRTGGLHKRGKFHESIISRALFPIKSLSPVVPPVLYIKLGIVLKLYQILLSITQQKDNIETSTVRADQEEKWECESEKLLEKEAELLYSGCIFIDFENLKDRFEARLSEDWPTLDNIAKNSYNKPNKKSENERCKSVVCCISKYDSNINWIECIKCLNWVHFLCECVFSQGTSLSDDADFQCLRCRSFITEKSIWDYFVAKSDENSERQRKLELDIAELKSQCEALKDSIDLNIGDYECQSLETLDRVKVVHQEYHQNVFIGNHCKIILNIYEKLCDVVSDEPEFHEHISECFHIYSELDKLISAKRF